MTHIDISTLDLSDTMREALQECIADPEGRVEVAWSTAQALEKRGLVERGGNWIWVTAEMAAQYAPPASDDEDEDEEPEEETDEAGEEPEASDDDDGEEPGNDDSDDDYYEDGAVDDDDDENDPEPASEPESVAAPEPPARVYVYDPVNNPAPELPVIYPRVKGIPRQSDGTITARLGLVTLRGPVTGWDADSVWTDKGAFPPNVTLVMADQRDE